MLSTSNKGVDRTAIDSRCHQAKVRAPGLTCDAATSCALIWCLPRTLPRQLSMFMHKQFTTMPQDRALEICSVHDVDTSMAYREYLTYCTPLPADLVKLSLMDDNHQLDLAQVHQIYICKIVLVDNRATGRAPFDGLNDSNNRTAVACGDKNDKMTADLDMLVLCSLQISPVLHRRATASYCCRVQTEDRHMRAHSNAQLDL